MSRTTFSVLNFVHEVPDIEDLVLEVEVLDDEVLDLEDDVLDIEDEVFDIEDLVLYNIEDVVLDVDDLVLEDVVFDFENLILVLEVEDRGPRPRHLVLDVILTHLLTSTNSKQPLQILASRTAVKGAV